MHVLDRSPWDAIGKDGFGEKLHVFNQIVLNFLLTVDSRYAHCWFAFTLSILKVTDKQFFDFFHDWWAKSQFGSLVYSWSMHY